MTNICLYIMSYWRYCIKRFGYQPVRHLGKVSMKKTIDISIIKRLAFIKYLVNMGVTQSLQPEPANAICILMFHDAIELFMHLASEVHNVGKSQVNFLEYWDFLARKFPDTEIPQRESMRRLNKARVALKHHGTLPSKLDLESFRAVSTLFFDEATSLFFNVEFSDISLVDFINEEQAREFLHEAVRLLSENRIKDSVDKSALAFELLINDYEKRKRNHYGSSPFYFGRNLTFLDSFFMGLGYSRSSQLMASDDFQRKLGDFVDIVKESLEAIQNAIKILAMGIDYPKYSRFKMLTPHVTVMRNGETQIAKQQSSTNNFEPKDAQFCIDFVIETAFKLQESDYTIEDKNGA